MSTSKLRVLIVEDSAVVREHLRRIIDADPRLEVAAMAASGEEALAIVDSVAPDVISMDIHLPGIEGLETTRRIMAQRPTPIVVVSGIARQDVNLSMEALKAGALSVVDKPVSSGHEDYAAMGSRLCTQLAIMSEVKVIRRREPSGLSSWQPVPPASPQKPNKVPAGAVKYGLLAVAASTGGPNALVRLLNGLGTDFPLPIAIVQHMSPGFMDGFADWLNSTTPFACCVVHERVEMKRGCAYVAPSGLHLVCRGIWADVEDGPPSGSHKPSANVLFGSVARGGIPAIGVLLTGMGDDGAQGMAELHRSTVGTYTIAEDASTAVVYGMPAAAAKLGAVRESLPLESIAPRILELVKSGKGA
ncbi:chemotaxis response regulator protein-glutamate methylesterase [Bryobacterales bacterium F-183]|nr:chemotaxis response regulator protein-glutamate methylesterase [Bryobacterales bacterium F-183]